MLKCCIKITVSVSQNREWVIDRVIDCHIFKSADVLLDSCRFSLPVGLKWDGKLDVPEFEKSEIFVEMGYDDNLSLVFHGFVMYMQFDSVITVWCSGLLAKYKYINLGQNHTEIYGFPFDSILKHQGVKEKIICDFDDKPWIFELEQGSIFGLLEKLKRLRIHATLLYDENDNPFIVLSRRYCYVIDRGIKFSVGKNIIDFKDTLIKNDIAEDIQFNANACIVKQIHACDAEGNEQVVDAVIQVMWPEWRGRRVDLTFWGVDWSDELAEQANDACIRACVIRGSYNLASLTTFGANFVQPLEKVAVDWLQQVSGDYIVVSNQISYSSGGIRQKLKLF